MSCSRGVCIFPSGEYKFMSKAQFKALVNDDIFPDLTTVTFYVKTEEKFMLDLWHGHKKDEQENKYSIRLVAFNDYKKILNGPVLIYSTMPVSHERWEEMITPFL